jgi:hypothetical protein
MRISILWKSSIVAMVGAGNKVIGGQSSVVGRQWSVVSGASRVSLRGSVARAVY